ncbi:MAG TPA: ABC transporter substrate-binding protein [Opitutaceae bacterium]|nr:ABC transporter substrate-binding protein [Opitutaceae bacterium]
MIPLRFSVFIALVLSFALRPHAATAADDPAPTLVSTINGVIDLTLGQSTETILQRLPEIRTKMNESFAIEVIVQRAFGRNWSKLSAAQQAEVIDLLGKIVIRTYATQLSTGERPKINITASRDIGGDRREIVSTASRGSDVVNVIYRLGRIDGKWKVYDVLAEGVSVVGNYRQQFDAHFEKKNANELLETLRSRLTEPLPAPAK